MGQLSISYQRNPTPQNAQPTHHIPILLSLLSIPTTLLLLPLSRSKHRRRTWRPCVWLSRIRYTRHRAPMCEEKDFNRDGQSEMQREHHDQQHLANLRIRRAQHGIQVPQQERRGQSESDTDEDPVQETDLRP